MVDIAFSDARERPHFTAETPSRRENSDEIWRRLLAPIFSASPRLGGEFLRTRHADVDASRSLRAWIDLDRVRSRGRQSLSREIEASRTRRSSCHLGSTVHQLHRHTGY